MIGYTVKIKESAYLSNALSNKIGIIISKYVGVGSYHWQVKLINRDHSFPVYDTEIIILSKRNLSMFI